MYEIMLGKGVGNEYASTYDKIAAFFEFEELNYRKADKILRMGVQKFSSDEKYDKQLKCLLFKQDRLAERMDKHLDQEAKVEIAKIVKQGFAYLPTSEKDRLQTESNKVYNNQRRSYTKN